MKSRNTNNILYRLSTTADLATKTMGFLTDDDHQAITVTSVHFSIPLKFRKIYSEKLSSYSAIGINYQKMRSEFHYAYQNMRYAVHRPKSIHINAQGVITYYNPGSNPSALLAFLPAGYSLLKSGFHASQCLVKGALCTIGFFTGGARDVARLYTKPTPVSLIKPSAAVRLQS